MKRISIAIILVWIGSLVRAEPGPGDVFREYKWRPEGKWQRVTGPEATAEGAKEFLPNSVNTIRIDDLRQRADKVEVYIEMLLCHGGTVDKKIRINTNPWLPIPESSLIPGKAGQGPPNSEYQYMRYPCVRIPMKYLRHGNNTFEFTCSRGTSLGGWWPQWILYGVTFRVYYDNSKPHPTGTITKPSGGSTIGESPVLEAKATGPRPIKQVDFIGFYEDFNWEGDGNYRQWHYRYLYNEIKSHIGTATNKPYKVIWDNSWVPTQDRPMKIMARIVDSTGMCYMTSAVENIHLVRDNTVRMYKPYDVPKKWSTRVGNTHKCKTNVNDDLSKAVAAKIVMTTWNGVAADEIGINGKKIVTKVGKNHDLSYDEFDVPLNLIKSGTNTLYTHSSTTHHGIEVQWPGMVLMVRYSRPESKIRTANWNFEEIIIDNNPPQPSRITDVEIVDIDNNGRLDLWFGGRGIKNSERKFAWYKNIGDIQTWPRKTSFTGSSIGSAWGDIDSDGDMDLITGRDRGKAALVWMENPLNNGGKPETEIWKVYQIHPDPEDPDEVHTTYIDAQSKITPVLDMNRDGRLDIVIAAFKKTLWYVPGPKDPRKGPWKFYKVAEGSPGHGGACIADLNADGNLDIVWGNDWYENAGNPTAVPWRRHSIDGNWPDECKIAIGDLNKDGFLDVVLTGEESSEGVSWYQNPGGDATETWEKHLVVSDWKGLHSCQLADFDKDGDLDIFTAQMHERPGQRIAILENKDISSNEWESHILSTVGSHNAKVADIEGDGDPDIVGKNYEQDKRPRIWINPNNNKLSLDDWQRHVVDSNNPSRYTILAGDLNGDGNVDIVTGTSWYRNLVTGCEGWQRQELGSALGNAMILYDFDGDGDLDVLGEGFGWALNNGKGVFSILTNISASGGFVQGAAVGQFRNNCSVQVPYTYKNGSHIRMLTPSNSTWSDTVIFNVSGKSKSIDVGDIDRDGDLDIIFVGRDTAKMQWLRNNANDTFTAFAFADSPVQINHRCHLGDINADGRLDIVIGHKGKLVTWYEQGLSARSNWKKHVIADSEILDFDPLALDVADIDRDGDLDVVIGEHTPDRKKASQCSLYIFENANRFGTQWVRHMAYAGDEHHQGAQVIDVDHDGDLDIISVGWTHNNVMLYENKAIDCSLK